MCVRCPGIYSGLFSTAFESRPSALFGISGCHTNSCFGVPMAVIQVVKGVFKSCFALCSLVVWQILQETPWHAMTLSATFFSLCAGVQSTYVDLFWPLRNWERCSSEWSESVYFLKPNYGKNGQCLIMINIIYFFRKARKSQPRTPPSKQHEFSWPSHHVFCFHQCLVLCQAWMWQSLSCAQSLGIFERCFFFTGRVGIRSAKNQWLVQRDSYSKRKEHRFYPTSGCLGSGLCFQGLQGFLHVATTNVNQSAYHLSSDQLTLIIYCLHIGDSWWWNPTQSCTVSIH